MSTLISGFNSTKLSAATRHLQVGRVIAIELAVQSVSLVVMVTGAWLFKSVYALAVGYVVGSTVQCLMTHFAAPGINNRFRWDVSAVWEIVHFGKWIFLSTAISFFAMQLDKLAFGKMFPLDAVGVYGIAAGLAVLTPNLLARLQGMIAFPIYSRAMHRDQPLKDVFERSKVPMLIVGGYLVAGCIACAQSFISFAYDDRYQAAGTYIIILTIGAWFEVIYGVYMNALLASGKAGSIAAMNGAKVATFCILVVPAAKLGGLAGAVTAVAASDFARTTACILFARKIGLRNHTSDVLFSAQAIGVGLGVYWLMHHSPIAPDSHPLVSLVLGGVLVSIAFIPSLLMAKRVIGK
jgi:O-antigen/teichoic acid export membrane protein